MQSTKASCKPSSNESLDREHNDGSEEVEPGDGKGLEGINQVVALIESAALRHLVKQGPFCSVTITQNGRLACGEENSRACFHRILEWFVLKSTLKLIQFHPPTMGRDTFH